MSFEGNPREKRTPYPYLMTLSGLDVTYEYSTPTRVVRETYSCSVSFAPNDVAGTLQIGEVYNSGGVRVHPDSAPNPNGWSLRFTATIKVAVQQALTEAFQSI